MTAAHSLTQRNIAAPRRAAAPLLVGSACCRSSGFGHNHPLAIPRVATVLGLCEELGWLDANCFREAPVAQSAQLTGFHDAAYVAALHAADAAGTVPATVRQRFGFGTMENPLFPGVYARAATAVGGSILAAQLALEGRVVFHPAGGTHHARRDRASGFCYFNDPVFAILALREGGSKRVLYVDLDAHHGDAVQDAFAGDDHVLLISVHEDGRWPHTGSADDDGGGNAVNLPVPRGCNDNELHFLLATSVLPRAREFAPDAVVVTCGADALAGDPLSGMALSNVSLWNAVEACVALAAPAVVLGGGGYNPWTVARCWAGLWGRLTSRELPATLPWRARRILEQLSCDLVDDEDVRPEWSATLVDPPNPGPVGERVRVLAMPRGERRVHGVA